MTIHYFCVFTTKQAAEEEHFPGSLEAVLFPHRGWLCHSLPSFQHLLTLYCCRLYSATHRLPLSATLLSLAALNCSKQRWWPGFPLHTPSPSLHTPAEEGYSLAQADSKVFKPLDEFKQSPT